MSYQEPLWKDRPQAYRFAYYRNVFGAFFTRTISLRTALFGLKYKTTCLLMRPPGRGFLVVCPDVSQELFRIHATNFQAQLDALATNQLKGNFMSLFDDADPVVQWGFLAATAVLVLTLVVSFIAILWK